VVQFKNYTYHLTALGDIGMKFNRGNDQKVTHRAPSLITSSIFRMNLRLNAFTDRVGLIRL